MAKQAKEFKEDYEIGYQKPPKDTRFVKGQSGNPSGRPPGSKNWATILNAALQQKVTVLENGSSKQVTKIEAATMQLVNKAASGDSFSIRLMLNLVPSMEAVINKAGISSLSNEQDRVVLEALMKQVGADLPIEINAIEGNEKKGSAS